MDIQELKQNSTCSFNRERKDNKLLELNDNQNILIKPTFWGRWLGNIKTVQLQSDKIFFIAKNDVVTEYELSQVIDFPSIEDSFFGARILFRYKNSNIIFSKLSKNESKIFFKNLESIAVSNIQKHINSLINIFHTLTEKQYLRDSQINHLNHELSHAVSLYKNNISNFSKYFSPQFNERLSYICSLHPINEEVSSKIRKQYEDKILNQRKHFFDVIESNPLTEQQRLAVIRNNDINMVLAAAGTGKTSVMVAKALDLMDSGAANSDEILILAYNRDAAIELTERLETRAKEANVQLEQKPSISTFHALGRQIIRDCGKSVHLSKFAEDPQKLSMWFDNWLVDYIKDNPNNLARVIKLAYQPIDPFTFNTIDEYDQYIRDNDYRTFQGERVRGYQELLIANWLFLNSITYEYEPRYVAKSRIEIGFDYKPDFYLGEGIYLEHFGIDREGRTRPDIDATTYNENIEKKRELHIEHNTTLLETYHYNWTEGTLYSRLEQLMDENSIVLKEKTQQEILDALNKSGMFEENKNRYVKCLQAIRTERLNHHTILKRLTDAEITYAQEYTTLLMNVHDAYVEELNDANEIDFDDMILQATHFIKSGIFKPKWTHILVDEFQDISMARLELLKEIYTKGPKPIWTVVGDDWQSIYRFSGGKLEVTTRFNEMIGSHSRTTLEKTYRYNNSIANTAGRFIMENPEQYKKDVKTHTNVDQSCVHLYDTYYHGKDDTAAKTLEVLKSIKAEHPDASIAILARYRYLLTEAKEKIKDKKNIKFWTFHGSKGLEADYCILIGFFQGKTGFPNKNKEDAVVEALLPMLDSYPHSEERRLLYVALTRAKKESYLIANADSPSEFINELLSPKYNLNIVSERFKSKYRSIFKCPICSTGYFVMREGQFGHFYSCSSGKVCHSSPRICEKCGSPSIDGENKSICRNPTCRFEIPICNKCGRPMRLREGHFGKFWGCSGYGIKNDQCTNTRKYF